MLQDHIIDIGMTSTFGRRELEVLFTFSNLCDLLFTEIVIYPDCCINCNAQRTLRLVEVLRSILRNVSQLSFSKFVPEPVVSISFWAVWAVRNVLLRADTHLDSPEGSCSVKDLRNSNAEFCWFNASFTEGTEDFRG
jgi:hypothetical protein